MSNPTASTSNGNAANAAAAAAAAAAAQIMPVAVNPANPVIQIDQKKVPVFYGEIDKDSLTVLNWCRRIDGLKTAFAWSDAATFCNATAALFGNAARIVTSWKVLDPVDYRETWTYLRKAMLNHWGDVKDSRSFIDALFALRPRTNDLDSLDSIVGDIMEAFEVVADSLSQPDAQTIVANGGVYTDAQVNAMLKAAHTNVMDQFTMAFLINFLAPNLRTKVLESKPTTMKQCVYNAREIQRMIRDKVRPVGSTSQKAKVFSIEPEETPESPLEEMFINLMKKHYGPRPNNANQQGNGRGKGKGKNSQNGNNSQGNASNAKKKCNYCGKFNHGMEDCFARKADKAPCYTTKGEPFYPKSDQMDNPSGGGGTFKPAAPVFGTPMYTPLPTARPKDFPHWV